MGHRRGNFLQLPQAVAGKPLLLLLLLRAPSGSTHHRCHGLQVLQSGLRRVLGQAEVGFRAGRGRF